MSGADAQTQLLNSLPQLHEDLRGDLETLLAAAETLVPVSPGDGPSIMMAARFGIIKVLLARMRGNVNTLGTNLQAAGMLQPDAEHEEDPSTVNNQ
jgi:hypothetical protein